MNEMQCMRCGVCCKKGGPSLQKIDLPVVGATGIPVADLVCLRAGEIISDPRVDKYTALPEERLKIRGSGVQWTCKYYRQKDHSCGIYSMRPIECRELNCSHPEDLFAAMEAPYLQRSDLVPKESALWACIVEHECLYPVSKAVAAAQNVQTGGDIPGDLTDLIRKEGHFRSILCERLELTDDALYPYFGRPLSKVLAPFGMAFSRLGKL